MTPVNADDPGEVVCRCGAHAVTRPGAYASLPTRDDLERLRG